MKFFTYGNFCARKKARNLSQLKGLDPVIKRKIIMRINLVAFFISISIMNVCASARAQTLNLTFKDAAITEVLAAIKKQSGYQFLYNQTEIKRAKPVSVTIKNANLKDALDQVFKDQPLNYQILDKTIVVKERKANENKTKSAAIQITGKVVDKNNLPIAGVTIKVKGTDAVRVTGPDGIFNISLLRSSATLIVSFVGYETKELTVDASIDDLVIVLDQENTFLQEVDIVSTGYQNIPKERATGSFTKINNELVNRRVSTNVLDRLEGVASGVIFNTGIPNGSNESPITVRGRSTIFANTKPLVVLDNFPYDGDIANINPNDVESITLLKDAAAASIWGARSGNGVIVITTKKGRIGQPLQIDVNSNLTIGKRPDLFYDTSFIPASDFIDLETFLFDKGFYNADLSNSTTRPVVSPVVEILARKRNGSVSQAVADEQINALRLFDTRNDFSERFYRTSSNQQYSVSLNGGTQNLTYLFSTGYDKNISNLIGNELSRLTINSYNNFRPIKNLEISAGLSYTKSDGIQNNPGYSNINPSSPKSYLPPYTRLVDDSGSALGVPKDYRYSYLESEGISNPNLLDWIYRPVNELSFADNKSKLNDIRFTPSIRYSFLNGFSADVRYMFEKAVGATRNYYSELTYFSRNLINLNTQAGGARAIPNGGILDQGNNELTSNTLRMQLNFDRRFSDRHQLAVITGAELKELITIGNGSRLYGYDDEVLTSVPVDFATIYPKYANLRTADQISPGITTSRLTDEFNSFFANASYTYLNRYTISASNRFDQSNLFGVETNQKTVPLWSVGGSWNISSEKFYSFGWLPYAKLRATYGFNGNIDKTVTAFTTATYNVNSGYGLGLQEAAIVNPPNSDLKWERVAMLNIGLDFQAAKGIISGSIEYYSKKGTDLIGDIPTPPSMGITRYRSNIANLSGEGIDLDINSNNLNGEFKWSTNYLLSYNTNRVTRYLVNFTSVNMVQSGTGNVQTSILPAITGRPIYGVYSYPWAGLDPLTGDPQGMVNGVISKDYTIIRNSTKPEDMVYHGPARPVFFGGIRNTVSFRNVALSANLTYKLGYYFRRSSVRYAPLYASWQMHQDYLQRWQKPGDEIHTDVPSLVYPSNNNRDDVYTYSEALVERGDHIRLQDISLSYDFSKHLLSRLSIQKAQVYLYANNLGIIWKSNNVGLDPDYIFGIPNPRTLAVGLKAQF